MLEDLQEVLLDDGPAGTEEFCCESIGAGRFARRQVLDSMPDLILVEGRVKVFQERWLDELRKVDGAAPGHIGPNQSIKVRKGRRSHVARVGEDGAIN